MTTITFRTSVDDYEHEGDTQDAVESWKGVNVKCKKIDYSAMESQDSDSPTLHLEYECGPDDIQASIQRLRSKVERAKSSGNYGPCLHPSEFEWVLQLVDKQEKTNYLEQYATELKEISKLY